MRPVDTTIPLLLDVDTGVDDALAIALAVRSGVRMVGVTTVAGNVPIEFGTRNSLDVLSWLGAESVPVHRGAFRPLAVPYLDAAHVHGENGLGGATLPESRAHLSSVNGVQAILDAADRFSGELVIAALGPLTNIAIALSLRPELVGQVRRLVIMSGAFHTGGNVTPHAEFNAFADPHAAQQVMDASWNEQIAVGLDVTHRTIVARDQWEQLGEGGEPPVELVRQIAARTFTERQMDGFYLHDPLAVAVAIDPSLVSLESARVEVDFDAEHRGRTRPADTSGGVRVAVDVDAERFETRFAEALGIPTRSGRIESSRSE